MTTSLETSTVGRDVAPVRLDPDTATPAVPTTPASVDQALLDVADWPADLLPGRGATARLWSLLATLAASDLAVARAVEPHLDALAILDQAGSAGVGSPAMSTWGVFAAETPAARLEATQEPGGGWRLTGTKPWCSLADRLGAALVTARTPDADGGRGLFVVDLTVPGIGVSGPERWVARGLREIPSTPVRFDDVPAALVRDGDWYVDRPGFWWGGIGVAACWYGGAVGLARRLLAEARRRPDDQLLAMHLGAVDHRLSAARVVLASAAHAVDLSGAATDGGRRAESGPDRERGRILAKRVRATVADTCEAVLLSVGHALGPAAQTQEDDHAKRVADLQVYVRQQHAERDDVSLGKALLGRPDLPW
ncbi:acyl-CoA dehydrogenase [Cellulomonas chitinilytica]|uniref:Acyl-CoA dehydrogenase n=1 Tax=Cellulomonas chitinilytica TaxID=398759 RepID=A0A919U4Z9_9CELL|nr:acyl-CoA dehydrogenase family protein [Cellulomonas chitinilytica]GIG23664.1 acyl-CoA dehydrogenase [Cellulomonas chitinilytica]